MADDRRINGNDFVRQRGYRSWGWHGSRIMCLGRRVDVDAYNLRGLSYDLPGKPDETKRDYQKAKELGYEP